MANSQEVLLVRHGRDDESYIDGKFDADLTRDGIDEARDMSRRIVKNIHCMGGISLVQLYSSDRKRAIETTEIVQEAIDRAHYAYTVYIDDRFRGLQEGTIADVDKHSYEQSVRMLNHAWIAFDNARLRGDDEYCFGDPVEGRNYHPEIDGFIEYPYGESQQVFTDRVFCGFDNVLDATMPYSLPVVITHRGPVSKIKHLIESSNKKKWTEQHKNNELLSMGYNVILHPKIKDIDLCSRLLKQCIRERRAAKLLVGDAILSKAVNE